MTTGVPGGGDGGYADAPAAPTAPLAWGAGGPGQHTPTQPLPGVPHAPDVPRHALGRPAEAAGLGTPACHGTTAAPLAAPGPDRDPGPRARGGAGICHAAPGHTVGEHRAVAGTGLRPGARRGLPRAPGAVTVRRLADRHRGPPVLLRARLRPHRDRPGDRRPRHRAARPGRRHALPATGQDALHARPGRVRRRSGANHPGHQARPQLLQSADHAAVRRRRLLRPRVLRAGRGELRLLRRDPGRAELATGGAARGPGAGADRRRPDRPLRRSRGRGRRTCSAGWSPPAR